MITKWSYSRVSAYQQCPQRVKFKTIDRLPDPPGPAASRGIRAHKVLETFIAVPGAVLPEQIPDVPRVHEFREILHTIKGLSAAAEKQVGITREWKITAFDAPDAWGRAVFDVAYYVPDEKTVCIFDWKTGKPNGGHFQQLELYGAIGLLMHEEAEKSYCADYYLDIGPKSTLETTLHRKDLQPVLDKWSKMVDQMEKDTTFAPHPGQHCRWCGYAKSKGGPCSFG